VAEVLVVDDDQATVRLLAAELTREGHEVSVARDGCEAIAMAVADRPDLILLDVMLPGMDGIEVCRRLKADDDLRMVPIILVTANDLETDMVDGLDAGADDYVVKPFSSHVLAARVRAALRIKRSEDLLVEQAQIDPLTGLRNRRALMERLEHEWAHVQRHGRRLAVVMADVDHFKSVNDGYGHFVGDRLLQEISRTIAGQCRKTDLPARYGGEEFAIIATDETAAGAVHLAERCRRMIEAIRLPLLGETLTATASFGVADAAGLPSLETLLERADAALYAAKRAGRNTVRWSNPSVTAQAAT
jgi:two-component system chemotaxis response regulator CheY